MTNDIANQLGAPQSMEDKYQQVIDEIYHQGRSNDCVDAAYFLACAIKECLTLKDLGWGDTGYIDEKIGRALRSLGMKEVKA